MFFITGRCLPSPLLQSLVGEHLRPFDLNHQRMVRLQDLLLVVVVNYKHRSTWYFRVMIDFFFAPNLFKQFRSST